MTDQYVLYTCLPEGLRTEPSGGMRRVAGRLVRQAYDFAQWRLSGKFTAHRYYYSAGGIGNIGDHAVRQAQANFLKSATGGEIISVGWADGLAIPDGLRPRGIIIGGGGYFSFPNGTMALRIARDVKVLRKLGLPWCILGPGVNAPVDQDEDELVRIVEQSADGPESALRTLLDGSRYTLVRGRPTQRLLQRATGKPIHRGVDPAFFLDPDPILPKPRAPDQQPVIGINLCFHADVPQEFLARRLLSFCAVLRRLRERTGCRFVYFQHEDPEWVLPILMRMKGVPMTVCRGGPHELLAGYRTLDAHIPCMLHSAILATSVGVPTLGLAYDRKHTSFFDIIDMMDLLVPIHEWDDDLILDKALRLLSDGPDIRARLAQAKTELRKPWTDAMDWIAEGGLNSSNGGSGMPDQTTRIRA